MTALLLGLIMSFLISNDVLTAILRRVGFTHRTSGASIWSDVFYQYSEFVWVELEDGRRFGGWPTYFSDTPEEGSLFLSQAAWVDDSGNEVEIHGSGILLTKNIPIKIIRFAGNGT
jgi:Family of unknown function (DUF6338)